MILRGKRLDRGNRILGEIEVRLIARAGRLDAGKGFPSDRAGEVLKREAAGKEARRKQRLHRRFTELAPEVDLGRALARAPEVECSRQISNFDLQRCPLGSDPLLIVQDEAVVGNIGVGMEGQGVKAIGRSISLERCKAVLGEVEMRLIICACRLYGNNLPTSPSKFSKVKPPVKLLAGTAGTTGALLNSHQR